MSSDVEDLSRPAEALRLRQARLGKGFADAKSAATFFGWNYDTYSQHERGQRGIRGPVAEKYAKAFRVSAAWLLTGEGSRGIKVTGYVVAGGGVDDFLEANAPEFIEGLILPTGEEMMALIVSGDSQYPRFLDGEAILYDPRPLKPADLVDQYAVVQTKDGRRLIKILRANPNGGDRWRLESHNVKPVDDVSVSFAHRYLGVLARPEALPPHGRKK
jgi:phage repressor protein C with HTH and peptisase S24 domain